MGLILRTELKRKTLIKRWVCGVEIRPLEEGLTLEKNEEEKVQRKHQRMKRNDIIVYLI